MLDGDFLCNATKIFIGGAEITRLTSTLAIILTSLSLPHPSPTTALNRMMMAEAMIRLRTSGYSILALAMRVKYPELITLHNMTIFAVDDSSIFHGGHSYVHSVRFHIVPNRILKLADLENLPAMTVLPTLEIGETLTVTTPGGGGALSPLRINYVKIKYPNLIYNLKMVVHGLAFRFLIFASQLLVLGRSAFYPTHTGEFTSDERYSTDGNLQQTTAAPLL
ncbi:Fasciclin-like arabinogalactan protein 19 [Bienertia sinuspersici]